MALVVGPIACATSSERAAIDVAPNGGPNFGPAKNPDSSPRTASGCAESNKDVYVIADDRTFYSFNPPSKTFKPKGVLQCGTGATPTSMAIDRAGIAWVRHDDESIWKVDTTTLECELSSFKPHGEGFTKFGMGFATETKGGSSEVLYLSDSSGRGLAKLDTSTLMVSYIGPFTGDLAGSAAELTGTGDGTLHGFFTTSPARIAQISTTTGEILSSNELPGVAAGLAWALSFYGGDFYVYTNQGGGSLPLAQGGSDVTRFRPSDGVTELWMPKIGFKIVGAGVSTCAPTSSPR